MNAVLSTCGPRRFPSGTAGLEVSAADSGSSPREQVALAERALEEAKRAAARGEDTVLLIDSLSRLARAYGAARAATGARPSRRPSAGSRLRATRVRGAAR